MNKFGIENYWKVMSFLLALGVDIEQALADKKINLADLQYFYKEFFSANAAYESKEEFLKEGMDLTEEESAEIHKRAKAQLGESSDDAVKVKILAAEKLISGMFEFLSTFKTGGSTAPASPGTL